MVMVRIMVKGRPSKKVIDVYIDPEDLIEIDRAVQDRKVESRGQYIRNAIRHYKDVRYLIYEECGEK